MPDTCKNLHSSQLTVMQLEATVEGYHRTACGDLRVAPQWVHAAATAATRTHFAFDGSGVSAGMRLGACRAPLMHMADDDMQSKFFEGTDRRAAACTRPQVMLISLRQRLFLYRQHCGMDRGAFYSLRSLLSEGKQLA